MTTLNYINKSFFLLFLIRLLSCNFVLGLYLASEEDWQEYEGNLRAEDLLVRADICREQSLNSDHIREEISLIKFALDYAYGGRNYIDKKYFDAAISKLDIISNFNSVMSTNIVD